MTALTYYRTTGYRTTGRPSTIAGVVLAAGLLVLGVLAMLVLIWADYILLNNPIRIIDAINWPRLAYSLKSASLQAGLSTLFSLVIAVPAAIALSRRRARILQAFVLVISLAMVLPTGVAASGLLSVWGRQGVMADICQALSFCGGGSIYGLHGVVIAHMMLNVPLMIRVFMPLLHAVAPSQWRLSAMLGLTPLGRFYHVEWRAVKPAIPGISALVFLLCFTSFALVLMLGGGPKVTTLEVEIYTAIRFNFNLSGAAGLSLVQFSLAAIFVAIIAVLGKQAVQIPVRAKYDDIRRGDLKLFDHIADTVIVSVLVLLVGLPVVMVAIDGLGGGLTALLMRPRFWSALMASVSIASISAVVVAVMAVLMAMAGANLSGSSLLRGGRMANMMKILLNAGVMLYLVIPSIVLGTASFILLRGYGDVVGNAFGVVVIANILMALPFAVRLLERRMAALTHQHDRLAAMLGISGWNRLRVLTLPPLERDLGVIMGLTAALSIGDLGVIALFAHDGFKTLPWMLYQLSGRYASNEAAALALMLMLLTVLMFGAGRVIMRLVISGIDGRGRYA